ncbi:MAG: outer membrane protein [Rhodomicrobium sp.]
MKLLTGILAATLTSVVAIASANAADMYVPGPGGYKDGPAYVTVNWSGLYVGVNGGYGWNDKDSSIAGGFGGGQIGYNLQRGNIVFGVEADLEGADITKSGVNATGDYFGTVRGRVGYAFDRALVYGTAGFGFGGCSGVDCPNTNFDGWVAGGGIEYKLAPAWSVKAEYQHIEATSETPNYGLDTFRVGVNYFVGGVYEPLK